MIREMLPDGTYREVTWDEIREEVGDGVVRAMQTPPVPESEMTDKQRVLADRMQAEMELNNHLEREGLTLEDVWPGYGDYRRRAAAERSAAGEADASGPAAGETGEDGR